MKLLFAFIFAAPLFAVGQERFAPGFYVTNSQDTIRGYIVYKMHYSTNLDFRIAINSPIQTLTIDEVKSFGFASGELYYRLTFEKQNNLAPTPTFVQMIAGDGIQLFKYRGNYIIGSEEKGQFRLAKGKTSDAKNTLKNHQTNVGIFNILFQDCPPVKADAQKVAITSEKLSQLLKAYHDCRSLPHREFQEKQLKRISHVAFFVGQSSSKISFPDITFENSEFPFRSKFATEFQPTFGILGLLRGRGPASILAFQGELAYTRARFGSTWVRTANSGSLQGKETTITNLQLNLLTCRTGLRLTARSHKVNPYLSFGLGYQRPFSTKGTVKTVTEINSVSKEENLEFEMKYSSLVVWAATGLKKDVFRKHAVFAEGHYESSFVSNGGNIASIALRLGFLF